MKQRTDKLLAAMPGGFEAALVSTDVNRFYFLGFDSGDAGTVLILPDKTYFIIDSRYIEIAEATVKEAEVILEGKALEQVRDILAAHGVKHLYLENKATLAYADRVRAALPGVEVDTGAVLSDAIDAIRAVKSEEEFDAIRRAQVITDACFEHMLGYIKPGVREIDAALEMEVFMKSHGAGKLAFDTIFCLGGKNEPAARRARRQTHRGGGLRHHGLRRERGRILHRYDAHGGGGPCVRRAEKGV